MMILLNTYPFDWEENFSMEHQACIPVVPPRIKDLTHPSDLEACAHLVTSRFWLDKIVADFGDDVDEDVESSCWEAWAFHYREREGVVTSTPEEELFFQKAKTCLCAMPMLADALTTGLCMARGMQSIVEYAALLTHNYIDDSLLLNSDEPNRLVLDARDRLANRHVHTQAGDAKLFVETLPTKILFWSQFVFALKHTISACSTNSRYPECGLAEELALHSIDLYVLLLHRLRHDASEEADVLAALDVRGVISKRWRAFAVALLKRKQPGINAALKEMIDDTKGYAEQQLLAAIYLYYSCGDGSQSFSEFQPLIKALREEQMEALGCSYHRQQQARGDDSLPKLTQHTRSGHWSISGKMISSDSVYIVLPATLTSTPESSRYDYERISDKEASSYGIDVSINSVWKLNEKPKASPSVVSSSLEMPDHSVKNSAVVEHQLVAFNNMYGTAITF